MKKEKEYRIIQLIASERWIRSHGESIWLRNNIALYALPWLVILVIALIFVNTNAIFITMMVTWAITYIIGMYKIVKCGKIYWQSKKDMEEPIELEPLPKWRLWRRR